MRVFNSFFSIIYDLVKHNRLVVSIVLVIAVAAAVAGLGMLSFDSSIELMLPDQKNIH